MPDAVSPGGSTAERARAVRAAVCRLAALASETAEAASALALLLVRVANAEGGICSSETACIETILASLDRVEEDQAVLLAEIGKHRLQDLDSAGTYRVSRRLRQSTDRRQLGHVVDQLVEVATADGTISPAEAAAIRQVATELGLDRHRVAETLAGAG